MNCKAERFYLQEVKSVFFTSCYWPWKIVITQLIWFLQLQPRLFLQNARGTRAPPGQPLCEQNVQRPDFYRSGQKIRGQQEPRRVLHLRGLSHHSHFQREGSKAHPDSHEESRSGRPARGHSLSLRDVGLFQANDGGWAAQTFPPSLLFQWGALQGAELRGHPQVWKLAAWWDLAAKQRALRHHRVQKLQVSHNESITHTQHHWPVLCLTGKTYCCTCRTAPLTGPSVKPCSIKSTSMVLAITWGLKSCSGDRHAQR